MMKLFAGALDLKCAKRCRSPLHYLIMRLRAVCVGERIPGPCAEGTGPRRRAASLISADMLPLHRRTVSSGSSRCRSGWIAMTAIRRSVALESSPRRGEYASSLNDTNRLTYQSRKNTRAASRLAAIKTARLRRRRIRDVRVVHSDLCPTSTDCRGDPWPFPGWELCGPR